MAVRYYCPQWCHQEKGWLDLPSLASKKLKEANDSLKEFLGQQHQGLQGRVIRKPKGWKPDA